MEESLDSTSGPNRIGGCRPRAQRKGEGRLDPSGISPLDQSINQLLSVPSQRVSALPASIFCLRSIRPLMTRTTRSTWNDDIRWIDVEDRNEDKRKRTNGLASEKSITREYIYSTASTLKIFEAEKYNGNFLFRVSLYSDSRIGAIPLGTAFGCGHCPDSTTRTSNYLQSDWVGYIVTRIQEFLNSLRLLLHGRFEGITRIMLCGWKAVHAAWIV
ncbi:hypothetical protein BDV23DRAFT_95814 [Aspergillus alliaceus]|uniref:Uncharacterized protein n=1 Tax=Petromyces alliaceus TaxID=209559 RepID=A0A5N7CP28_PETAA|nr:hypothetical protein BDV23DRAFT_95814 [Aspergillus alliaceus]